VDYLQVCSRIEQYCGRKGGLFKGRGQRLEVRSQKLTTGSWQLIPEDFRIESLQRIPEWFSKKIMKTSSRPLPGLRKDRLRGCMELEESGRRTPDLKSAD
jgi:hypothetical protein